MSTPFLGEIKMFGGNFAPFNYALCNGQILSIQQNTALFSLLGTNFGGNGTTTFALPNMQSRAPLHQGQGSALSPYSVGEETGSENVTLILNNVPNHTHTFTATEGAGGTPTNVPGPTVYLANADPSHIYLPPPSTPSLVPLAPQGIGFYGQSQPHTNLQPLLAITFIIALNGIFPSRN
jgi:microcystin-dependent protein